MAGIGATLREAREQAHLDIMDFESRTKIRAKYLRALEDEEWSLLPGYTFTKSFLRTYADMLGLDGRMLVDEFKRQHPDPAEVDLNPAMPSRRDQRSRGRERPGERGKRQAGPSGRMLAAALAVVLIAAAVLVVRELTKGKGTPQRTTQTTTTSSSTTRQHRS